MYQPTFRMLQCPILSTLQGYPSDGIVQVEEEEEAQEESDDRDTYTIEEDYPTKRRPRPVNPPIIEAASRRGRRRATRSSVFSTNFLSSYVMEN